MIRTLILLLIFSFASTIAQSLDSISTDVKIFPDTTFIQPDSLLLMDSLLTKVKPDSIVPIYSQAFTEKSFVLKNDELQKLEYQYTGNYFKLFPFNFIKDLGFTGQLNETFLYGVGNNAVSYLIDGVSFNDRISNSLNLNLIQSEDIDSIEVVPLPRGFLYGAYNNPVSINFITKDFISIQPFSRIRFYQGANRDMMLDGSFNAILMKRLIGSFDITNRIFDGTYANSDYSIWQGKVKLKYLLSNAVNIIASYNYNDYKAGYSGGVDVDSIIALGENVNDVLYDFRAAPMIYPNGELKTLTHLPRLRFLISPTEWMKTDASLFFMFNRYEKGSFASEYTENKTYGLNIRNDAEWNLFKFQLNIDYDKRHTYVNKSFYPYISPTQLYTYQDEIDENTFSISGIVSAYFNDSTIIPSVFYKTTNSNFEQSQYFPDIIDRSSQGLGLDIIFKPKPFLDFYVGASFFKPKISTSNEYSFVELGTKFQTDFLLFDLKYFMNDYSYGFYTGGMFFNYYQFGKLTGIGATIKLNYWKLLLEFNSSHYSSKNSELNGVPDFQTQTGLYYTSKLFNDNLDLKTGFVFYYTGKNNVYTYEQGLVEVPASNKLDFTLAGEIQKIAIVYFTWQNLLDNNYYIIPYYPMPSRNIRFGVAWKMFN